MEEAAIKTTNNIWYISYYKREKTNYFHLSKNKVKYVPKYKSTKSFQSESEKFTMVNTNIICMYIISEISNKKVTQQKLRNKIKKYYY